MNREILINVNSWAISFAIFSCFFAAALMPVLHIFVKRFTHGLASLFAFGVFVLFLSLAPQVENGESLYQSWSWAQSLGVNFSFRLDGLGLLFSLVITFTGALILFYSGSYFSDKQRFGYFNLLMLAFMGSMLGIVTAGDLITTYVFWELTTLCSFLLIGFHNHEKKSRSAAKQALLVTGASGLCLLAGSILISQVTGSFDFLDIAASKEALKEHSYYQPILTLLFVGIFAKSAQVPFHFWLPSAMSAPSPVSAYLHSATMVKAGIFLLARLTPALSGTAFWTWSLVGVGVATMCVAALMCFCKKDLKLILAYLTLVVLGLLTALFGLSGKAAVYAAITYLLVHALYKASLFLSVGIVDHLYGTRNTGELSGLLKSLKLPSYSMILATLSMIGLIPFFGFVGKELVLKALKESTLGASLFSLIMICVTATALLILQTLFGSRSTKSLSSPSFAFYFAPGLLALLGLIFGFFPAILSPFIDGAVASVVGTEPSSELKLWHGFAKEFWFSTTSIAGGILLYVVLRKTGLQFKTINNIAQLVGPKRGYKATLDLLNALATFITNAIQNGRLKFYLIVLSCVFVILSVRALLDIDQLLFPDAPLPTHYDWLALFLTCIGAIVATRATSVLSAFVGLGTSGYGVVLLYLIYSMPDLALTQFLVETFTVIMIALVFVCLPSEVAKRRSSFLAFDLVMSVSFGILMTLIIWQALSQSPDFEAVEYFKSQSYILAHGRNVVNVILIDFRALDTLGEVTVIILAAAGVTGLYKLNPMFKAKPRSEER